MKYHCPRCGAVTPLSDPLTRAQFQDREHRREELRKVRRVRQIRPWVTGFASALPWLMIVRNNLAWIAVLLAAILALIGLTIWMECWAERREKELTQ